MDYIQRLKSHASTCQLEADKMAIELIKQRELTSNIAVVQGICDFNLYWLKQLSPLLVRDETLEVLAKIAKKFTRKLTVGEVMKLDGIIYHGKVTNFRDIKSKFIKHAQV